MSELVSSDGWVSRFYRNEEVLKLTKIGLGGTKPSRRLPRAPIFKSLCFSAKEVNLLERDKESQIAGRRASVLQKTTHHDISDPRSP
jgi:hypothetical protein